MKDDVQLLIFISRFDNRNVYFGIPMEQVQEISCMVDIIRIPRALDFMVGMIKLRDDMIPVIDLKNKFSLDDEIMNHKNSKIIVFEINGNKTGLIVDELSEVLRVPVDAIQISSATSIMSLPYFHGMVKIDNRIIIVLDLSKILSENEEKILLNMNLLCV